MAKKASKAWVTAERPGKTCRECEAGPLVVRQWSDGSIETECQVCGSSHRLAFSTNPDRTKGYLEPMPPGA